MNQEARTDAGTEATKEHHGLAKLLGVSRKYFDYCREERNFAAVLYHLLLDKNRLKPFLELIGHEAATAGLDRVPIYFEYAHLRDLWTEAACGQTIAAKNELYRSAIVSMLRMPEDLERKFDDLVPKDDCAGFNAFFGAPSENHIQMPSRWSDSRFDEWSSFEEPIEKPGIPAGPLKFSDLTFAQRACSLKWAFNAKPDLVLHLDGNEAICIEAKMESGMGSYRAKSDSSKGGPFRMNQLTLQRFILEDLLGYRTRFFIIAKKIGKSKNVSAETSRWETYSWHDVYGALTKGDPPTADEFSMVSAFQALTRARPSKSETA